MYSKFAERVFRRLAHYINCGGCCRPVGKEIRFCPSCRTPNPEFKIAAFREAHDQPYAEALAECKTGHDKSQLNCCGADTEIEDIDIYCSTCGTPIVSVH